MSDDHPGGAAKAARVVRWIILIPLAVLILLFVIDNRQLVQVEVPLTGILLQSPLFLVLLLVFLLGLGIGGLLAWLGSFKWRRMARRERRAREALIEDLERVSTRAGTTPEERQISPYLPPED